MTDRKPFRAGDVVFHGPSKEQWVLACDEDDGSVYPAGWPQSRVPAADCELVEAADDDARIAMLRQVAECGEVSSRGATARAQLCATDPEYRRQRDDAELDRIGAHISSYVLQIANIRARQGRDFVRGREHGPLLDAIDAHLRGHSTNRKTP